MSFWGWLTGDSKTVDKVADGIYNGIDKIFFTDEEKSDANKKGMDLFVEYQKATLPQNRTRRVIAVALTSLWCLFVFVLGVSVIFGFDFYEDLFEFIKNIVNPPFMLILSFYFLKRIINK